MGKNGSFEYAYNAQISVDADLQIIVAQHISQNTNSQRQTRSRARSASAARVHRPIARETERR